MTRRPARRCWKPAGPALLGKAAERVFRGPGKEPSAAELLLDLREQPHVDDSRVFAGRDRLSVIAHAAGVIAAYVGGIRLPSEYLGEVVAELRRRRTDSDCSEVVTLKTEIERWRRLFVLGEIDEVD